MTQKLAFLHTSHVNAIASANIVEILPDAGQSRLRV
jgi:hypothetical protein